MLTFDRHTGIYTSSHQDKPVAKSSAGVISGNQESIYFRKKAVSSAATFTAAEGSRLGLHVRAAMGKKTPKGV